MLNIKEIRTNTNYIIESLKKRNFDNPEKIVNEVLKLDKNYRENLEKKEKLLGERNLISKELANLKNNKKKFNELSAKVSSLKNEISKLENQTNEELKLLNNQLMVLPNTPHEDVPIGKDDTFNKQIKK